MNFWLFTPSYSHLHLIAFPLSSLAGKERLKHLLGSAYTLQKDVHGIEINLQDWTSSSFLRAQPWAMPAVDPGCPPHQQQLCPEGEGVERGWDSPSHCKELFLVLTCLLYSALHQDTLTLLADCSTWTSNSRSRLSSSFPVVSERLGTYCVLVGTQQGGQSWEKFCCSELGWVIGFAIVSSVPSQISLVQL